MAPTAAQRKAAEELRAEGNRLFGKQRYGAASERYTEAITLDPGNAALYVNRALCIKKLASPGSWERVAADAESALALDTHHMKAHYLMGMALRELGGDLSRAIIHLGRALEHAREKDDAIKDEIWRELAKANDAAWKAESAKRRSEAEAVRSQLRALTGGKASSAQLDWAALERIFERAARADTRGEVPSAFTCPLTMEVYRDPVTSKSGHTYERAALTEHLTKVGGWDPITRVPMTLAEIRPNIAMRNAVHLYLEEHGWAWHECF